VDARGLRGPANAFPEHRSRHIAARASRYIIPVTAVGFNVRTRGCFAVKSSKDAARTRCCSSSRGGRAWPKPPPPRPETKNTERPSPTPRGRGLNS